MGPAIRAEIYESAGPLLRCWQEMSGGPVLVAGRLLAIPATTNLPERSFSATLPSNLAAVD